MSGPEIGLVLDPDLGRLRPGSRELLAHWETHRGSIGVPHRNAFDPLLLRRFLGHLLIADAEPASGEPGQRRFRYRLIGTDLAQISGRDMTGRYFDDIYDPVALAEMKYCFGWVLEHKRPARVFGTLRHADRAFIKFDGIFMPVTADGTTADQVIGLIEPQVS